MKKTNFSFIARLKSFKHAFNGLKILIAEEHNARVQLFAALCAIIMAYLLEISRYEWILILFAIALVISFELINSSIENLADFTSPSKDPLIKKAKDLSAAAVLVSALSAFIIGMIIFLPKIILLF